MMHESLARQKHRSGYSCASSVYLSFSDVNQNMGTPPVPRAEGGISKTTLTNYVRSGKIERVGNGIYMLPDTIEDDMYCKQLDAFLAECNQESGLNIFIRYDDPDGFDSRLAHYGSFRNVKNYIV